VTPKSRGGTNRICNLVLACVECNREKGSLTAEEFGYPKIQGLASNILMRAEAFMNTVWRQLVEKLNAEITYGYVTKHQRRKAKIEKTHSNDAFLIAGGTKNHERSVPHSIKQSRRNNRCLQVNRCGFKRSIRNQRYKIQPNDLVRYTLPEPRFKAPKFKQKLLYTCKLVNDKLVYFIRSTVRRIKRPESRPIICRTQGIYGSGYLIGLELPNGPISTSTKNIQFLNYGKGFVWT